MADRLEVLRGLGPWILKPIAPPPEETHPGMWWGLRRSLSRDSRAISHHYDVSNTFYGWILGPTMAYTCAVYPGETASLAGVTKHISPALAPPQFHRGSPLTSNRARA